MKFVNVKRSTSEVAKVPGAATTALLEASDMLAVMPASLAAHYARLGVLGTVPLTGQEQTLMSESTVRGRGWDGDPCAPAAKADS